MNSIDLLDSFKGGNLIKLEDILKEVQKEHQQDKRLTRHLAFMQDHLAELFYQKKWLEFGFPEACLEDHADFVLFMMQSGFGYLLEMFKNSTPEGQETHAIRLNERGEPMVRMNGEFVSWRDIKHLFEGEKSKRYNYISPSGIVEKERYSKTLYPIEKITKGHFLRLHANASKLKSKFPGECVMQLVTNVPLHNKRAWYNSRLLDLYPQHALIRLIDKEGNVYSFSLQLDNSLGAMQLAATGVSWVSIPDWQEARRFSETLVTSWTITTDVLEGIKEKVEEIAKDGEIPFRFTDQSCTTFAALLCNIGGVSINTTTALSSLFLSLVPGLELVASALPVSYIERKIATLTTNSLFWFLGGAEITPDPKSRKIEPLFHSWLDLFDDQKSSLHHSRALLLWQREQPTTMLYRDQEKLSLKL
jgi:hypothetical protein